ncbi:cytochrome P450, partial [Paraphaeosphaeria sporulosa]
ELSESSTVLSQRAVYADMFGFKHTLGNFDHNELNSQKSRFFSRLIHIKGSQNLPHLFPHVEKRVIESLDELLAGAKPAARGVTLPIAETVRTMASRAMCVMFFGETLSRDTVFANALLRHPKEMISCMAAFQITPTFMSPYAQTSSRMTYADCFLTKGGRSQNLILEKLADIMGAGRDAWDEKPEMKKLTLAWNMAELTADNKYWQGPEHLAQSLLGIWFAAAHQPWMFLDFIILILAVRPDLQEAIRQEVRDSGPLDYSVIHRLPLLDSLIKEVVRLHPLDTMAVRRKAMRDFTFTTGNRQFCPAGSTVCVSAYDQMHDEKFYPHPDDFLPSRFVNTEDPLRGAQFVEVSEKYPIWGYGSLACPGRVHASTVIKIVILQILQRFDISLENEQERRMWSWETFTMPYESTRFVLKEKFC